MTILLIATLLIAGGFWWAEHTRSDAPAIPIVIGVLVLFFSLFGFLSRIGQPAEITAIERTRIDFHQALDGNGFVDMGLRQQAVEANQTIAEYRYWNRTLLDIWIVDEWDTLDFIE